MSEGWDGMAPDTFIDPSVNEFKEAFERKKSIGKSKTRAALIKEIDQLRAQLTEANAKLQAAEAKLAAYENQEPIGYIDKEQIRRWDVLRGTEFECPERTCIGFSREPFQTEMTDCTLAVFTRPAKAKEQS